MPRIQPYVHTPPVVQSSPVSGVTDQPKAEVKADVKPQESNSGKNRPVFSNAAGQQRLENAANRYDKMAGGMGW